MHLKDERYRPTQIPLSCLLSPPLILPAAALCPPYPSYLSSKALKKRKAGRPDRRLPPLIRAGEGGDEDEKEKRDLHKLRGASMQAMSICIYTHIRYHLIHLAAILTDDNLSVLTLSFHSLLLHSRLSRCCLYQASTKFNTSINVTSSNEIR